MTGTTRTTHLLTLMKQGDDAFNSRDFAAMNAVHHPDMVAHVTGNAEPIYGRAAHAAMVKEMFAMFPDVYVHNDPYAIEFGSGDWITVITRTTGTFTGELVLPDGTTIPPTGKAFDLDFGQTSKWDGDHLIEISAFWDSALQAKQIGLAQGAPSPTR
jgi:SnoaL-like polyketide cyclase